MLKNPIQEMPQLFYQNQKNATGHDELPTATKLFSNCIRTFLNKSSHKGLRLFYEKKDASKLQSQHISKIRLILTRLDAATIVNDMNAPGNRPPQLTGELGAFWSVKVNMNYRTVFRLAGEDFHDVDYLDYH